MQFPLYHGNINYFLNITNATLLLWKLEQQGKTTFFSSPLDNNIAIKKELEQQRETTFFLLQHWLRCKKTKKKSELPNLIQIDRWNFKAFSQTFCKTQFKQNMSHQIRPSLMGRYNNNQKKIGLGDSSILWHLKCTSWIAIVSAWDGDKQSCIKPLASLLVRQK